MTALKGALNLQLIRTETAANRQLICIKLEMRTAPNLQQGSTYNNIYRKDIMIRNIEHIYDVSCAERKITKEGTVN